jgi:hypothetical protein
VAGFDITSILDFRPPRYICPACRGLMHMPKYDHKVTPTASWCTVCDVKYAIETDDSKGSWGWSTRKYFENHRLLLDHTELLAHATSLAEVIRDSRGRYSHSKPWPTTRTFFEILSRAKYFVHFTSWGMSHKMIGALKLASMRVPVFGWASQVESHVRVELTEYPEEAPEFTAKVFASDSLTWDAPHQKLVVVDGLIAFKGSANLTNTGMRKADRGLDISETVTDYAEVTKLNHKYFAPVWRKITAPDDIFDPYANLDW